MGFFATTLLGFIWAIAMVRLALTREVTVCEGSVAHLRCSSGKRIETLRVGFGRRLVIPKSQGCELAEDQWPQPNCQYPLAQEIVTQMCDGKTECAVRAVASVFGPDPCDLTLKELDIEYNCTVPSRRISSRTKPQNLVVSPTDQGNFKNLKSTPVVTSRPTTSQAVTSKPLESPSPAKEPNPTSDSDLKHLTQRLYDSTAPSNANNRSENSEPTPESAGEKLARSIGSGIAIACVLTSFAAICIYNSGGHADSAMIRKNLSFCLLLVQVLFLFGVHQVRLRLLCTFITIFLTYFLLALFAWILADQYHLHSLLVKSETTEMGQSQRIASYVFAYGAPAVTVVVSLAVDRNSYGTPDHCWLNSDNYFALWFFVPMSALIVASCVFIFFSLSHLCRHANALPGRTKPSGDPESLNYVRTQLFATVPLLTLLTCTWLSALVWLYTDNVYLAYIFPNLNASSSVYMFIFYVIANKDMRQNACCAKQNSFYGRIMSNYEFLNHLRLRASYYYVTSNKSDRTETSYDYNSDQDQSGYYTQVVPVLDDQASNAVRQKMIHRVDVPIPPPNLPLPSLPEPVYEEYLVPDVKS